MSNPSEPGRAVVRSREGGGAAGPGGPRSGQAVFRLGPDLAHDLRGGRPYFLVPLDRDDERENVRKRVLAWSRRPRTTPDGQPGPPIATTDLYVLSHGWHRNFFGAAEAYDRIVSRVVLLMHRLRLPMPQPYHPIFLTMHWHSDPGENQWVDRRGRRSKSDFLRRVEIVFRRPLPAEEANAAPGETFTDVFEDIFELLSRLSAPDTSALGHSFDAEAERLAGLLDRYDLREAIGVRPSDKIAIVWSCYCQATPKRVLVDQTERPGRYLGFLAALGSLRNFVVATLGFVAVAGYLLRADWGAVLRWLGGLWVGLRGAAGSVGPVAVVLAAIEEAGRRLASTSSAWAGLFVARPLWWQLGVVLLSSLLVLELGALKGRRGGEKGRPGIPLFSVVMWLPAQILLTAPLLVYLLFTFLLGGVLCGYGRWRRPVGLFDERQGLRNDPRAPAARVHTRSILAEVARYPLHRLRRIVPDDTGLSRLLEDIDCQLAFWQMQMRAVMVGRKAAEFLADLLADPEAELLRGARIHFLGHSFGGLAVCNAVRVLALDDAVQARAMAGRTDPGINSLSLLQAAMASNWFEGEPRVREFVKGAIGCVFSRYDTANGFYYPLANNGRLAAGFVGLSSDGVREPDARWRFTSLVAPPDLDDPLYRPDGAPEPAPGPQRALNLDASRLIYEGGVAMGGGHGDIFKDDVVHLVWAITRMGEAGHRPAPQAKAMARMA